MNGHRPAITSAAVAWKPHAIHLAGQLVHAGVLTDGAWRNAMLDVPRHHFVPSYFHASDRTTWRHQRCTDTDSAAARDWLAHVYDRVPLIVALSGIDMWGRQHPVAVSPDPALTMRLLHTLDVRPTDRILELGTGSGHTTALLAHRVGDNQVTSVDIDTELHHLAAHRLAQLDLHPHLVLADSTTLDAPLHSTTPHPAAAHTGALPGAASARANRGGFDRVLVGHTVDHIPAAWLRHTNPGALVLATLVGGLGAGHPVLLHRSPATSDADTEPCDGGEGRLAGSFLPWPADDLPARRHHARLGAIRRPIDPAATRVRHRVTPVDPSTLYGNTPLALLHQLHLPAGTTAAVRTDANGNAATYLRAPDTSWAEINHSTDRHGRHDARIAGPIDLLTALRDARDAYHDLGQPDWTEFGVTATVSNSAESSRTAVWHSHPDVGPRWPVDPAPVRLGAPS